MSKQELKPLLLELLEDFDVRYKLNHNYPCQKTTRNKNSLERQENGRLENKEKEENNMILRLLTLQNTVKLKKSSLRVTYSKRDIRKYTFLNLTKKC